MLKNRQSDAKPADKYVVAKNKSMSEKRGISNIRINPTL